MKKSNELLLQENQQALNLASEKNYIGAETLLLKILTCFKDQNTPSLLQTITLNNLAFVYQKVNKSYKSISLLSKASSFVPTNNQEILFSLGTLINLCAINHFLGFYKEASMITSKALELTERSNSIEISAVVYYNVGLQLSTMDRKDKARKYFIEAISLVKSVESLQNFCVLVTRAYSSLINPEKKFNIVIKTQGLNSKHSSISSSKGTRYNNYLDFSEGKINLSAKISSFDTNRFSVKKKICVGMPYIKELRMGKKIIRTVFNTPKVTKKNSEDRGEYPPYSSEKKFFEENLGKKLKKIRNFILNLEIRLKEFMNNTLIIAEQAGYQDDYSERTLEATLTIQNWYKNCIKKPNTACF